MFAVQLIERRSAQILAGSGISDSMEEVRSTAAADGEQGLSGTW